MALDSLCPACQGSGVDPGDLGPVCGSCGGSGRVPVTTVPPGSAQGADHAWPQSPRTETDALRRTIRDGINDHHNRNR